MNKLIRVGVLWKFRPETMTEDEQLAEFDKKHPVLRVIRDRGNTTDDDALLVLRGGKKVGFINADDTRWVLPSMKNKHQSCMIRYAGVIKRDGVDSPQVKYVVEVDEDEVKPLTASEEWEDLVFTFHSIYMVEDTDMLDFAFDEIGMMLRGEEQETEATMEEFMDDIAEYSRFDMSVETSQQISDLMVELETNGTERAMALYDRLALISSRRRSRNNMADYAAWLDDLFEGKRAEEVLQCFKIDCIRKSRNGKVTREQLAQGLAQLNRELYHLPAFLYNHVDDPALLMHLAFYKNISRDTQNELLSALALKHQLEKVLGMEEEEKKAEERLSIPVALDTPEAHELWKVCQEEGWVDDRLQPMMNMSRATILASVISVLLDMTPRWAPFEELWHMKDMAKKFGGTKNLDYFADLQKTYYKALK